MCELADAVQVKVVETKQRNSEVGPWEGLPGALNLLFCLFLKCEEG